jgi:putative tricarboxylic transport membrane protein
MQNLFYCFVGVLLGTLIGVLPGLGPVPTIAMLLPITYALTPVSALIMLAGIYYGAQYGGSTTSILVNLPGESSSIVTCLDGYQMARNGRAGAALAISAFGSFFAGTVATMVVAGFAPPLSELALTFGPAEYFSLMVLGLIGAVVLARGSLIKAIGMIVLGLLFGMVGMDVNSGVARYTLNITELLDGINLVPLAMGLFAFSEILVNLEHPEKREVFTKKVSGMWLTKQEFREAAPAVLRGTILGSALGLLPGGGAVLASFAAYTVEKKISRTPENFGRGAIAGVAGPESANNAGAQTSFIPMLTLGIPPNAVMALMIGAMTIHNIQPGPQVMTRNPELFWGLVASMWIGNLMLLVLNLPLIQIWIKLLLVPYRLLYPAILLFCAIGVYSVQNNTIDVLLTIPLGILGYVFIKLGCEPAPLMLGFILGPMMEENLRRTMLLSFGDPTIFFTRPLSAVLLLMAAALVVIVALPAISKKRETVFVEEE